MPDNDDDLHLADDQAADTSDELSSGDLADIEEPVADELEDEEEIDDETLNNSQF